MHSKNDPNSKCKVKACQKIAYKPKKQMWEQFVGSFLSILTYSLCCQCEPVMSIQN